MAQQSLNADLELGLSCSEQQVRLENSTHLCHQCCPNLNLRRGQLSFCMAFPHSFQKTPSQCGGDKALTGDVYGLHRNPVPLPALLRAGKEFNGEQFSLQIHREGPQGQRQIFMVQIRAMCSLQGQTDPK